MPYAPPQPGLSANLQSFTEEAQARWNNRVSVLPIDAAPRFPNGYYEASFAIDGAFEHHDLSHFRDVFQTALKNHSGWPPFPYDSKWVAPIDDAIEGWIGPLEGGQYDVPAHHDFWRASPNGFFYTRRGYNEDGRYDQCEPGKTFDITTPTWRIGELLLQMSYVATALGAQSANLLMKLNWIGLRERTLVSVGNPNRILFSGRYFCHQDSYSTELSVPVGRISDALPELVFDILRPLYTLFDFWSLPKRLVEEELREMQKNTFA